ncbi:unnamed protein product [Adineta ricciae]|uniref:Uncharacterized protein n=1 Tax=Adineta ricciae TaxID=249248 RepID=A0A815QB49_ADIRI|nr:unnamed protein product [Adineta ricciae]
MGQIYADKQHQDELLKIGKHQITAITREDSTNKLPSGVEIKRVNYDDPSSLVEPLKVDRRAAAANVPWILPNEFGGDPTDLEMQKDNFIGERKATYRDYIEKLGKSSWIGLVCSFWYEFSLAGSSARYGFDFKDRTVTFFDDGNTRINTSTWPQTGRAVAKLLSLKVFKDNANDKSPCLNDFRNNYVYVSSFNISQKDMLDSILRVTGASLNDCKVNYEPAKDRYKGGVEEFKKGNMLGFAKLLYSRAFYPDKNSNYEERKDLPKENLDEYTKIAVEMAEKQS